MGYRFLLASIGSSRVSILRSKMVTWEVSMGYPGGVDGLPGRRRWATRKVSMGYPEGVDKRVRLGLIKNTKIPDAQRPTKIPAAKLLQRYIPVLPLRPAHLLILQHSEAL